MGIALLWQEPEVNPINRKARSIPVLNIVSIYGRVFFFSWMGFFIAFWSWYAFPPLLKDIIAEDINLTQEQVANSNIVALIATLLVRLVAGTACDMFGPRWTFAGCLLIGAIPTFLAGTIYNASQLMACRFFVGILGGSFVPCQVWSSGFFDKNVVGTANALTGGFGNAGGGVTYFVMPAIFLSLESMGHSPSVAWRISYIVPGILIVLVAIGMLLFAPDCPSGKWSTRLEAVEDNLRAHGVESKIVQVPGQVTEEGKEQPSGTVSPSSFSDEEKKGGTGTTTPDDRTASIGQQLSLEQQEMLNTARGEVIRKPSLKDTLVVCLSPHTIVLAAAYFCSFGGELAINSILGNYISQNLDLDIQQSGNYAAMFGLFNAVFRPLGGWASDFIYQKTHSLWAKKMLLHGYLVASAGFLVAIGLTDPHDLASLICLICIGMAFFLEGANGLTYAVVPHVHPHANGVVSGFVGAAGNLGGIVLAIIFRYSGNDYAQGFWVWGIICFALQVAVCWIRPIPKSQIGGR